MKRPARLASARHWLPTYPGQRVIRGYAAWFGVDDECAIRELEMLGVQLDPKDVARARAGVKARRAERARRKERAKNPIPDGYGVEWDDHFGFIAGYTEGGAPFGLTWEEMAAEEEAAREEAELFGDPFAPDGPDEREDDHRLVSPTGEVTWLPWPEDPRQNKLLDCG